MTELKPSPAKLVNTPNDKTGASSPLHGDHLAKTGDRHIDQARKILRQAVKAVAEADAGQLVKKSTVRHGECQKNQAAMLGGHTVDGCQEFMSAGEEGSLDALRCAACDCHRNFHRRTLILCEGECKHKLSVPGMRLHTPLQQAATDAASDAANAPSTTPVSTLNFLSSR